MIVTRRGFLKALGGAAIAVAAGEIIAPVARKIFLPPKGGWTPNALKFNSYAPSALNVGECTKSAEAIKRAYLRVSHQMPDHFSYRCEVYS